MGVAPYADDDKSEEHHEEETMMHDTVAMQSPRFGFKHAAAVVIITVVVGVACLSFGIPALAASLIGAGVASAAVTLGSITRNRRPA